MGGSTGAGKSTVAQRLACRLGLRCYHVDAFGWDHASRPGPAHECFLGRSLDERWVTADPVEMAEWFVELSRDRMTMITGDLAGLPREPVTIVEGPQVLPELVPQGAAGAFLLSTERFRATAIGARPFDLPGVSDADRARQNRLERDRLLAERIRAGASERGARIVEVDGSRDAEEIATEVQGLLPQHRSAADVRAVRRWENAVVARQLRLWASSGEGPTAAPSFPYGCECGEAGCCRTLELSVEELDALADAGGWVDAHA